jgi:hypothetical protein
MTRYMTSLAFACKTVLPKPVIHIDILSAVFVSYTPRRVGRPISTLTPSYHCERDNKGDDKVKLNKLSIPTRQIAVESFNIVPTQLAVPCQ